MLARFIYDTTSVQDLAVAVSESNCTSKSGAESATKLLQEADRAWRGTTE
jgi:hypothetical protein